MCLRKRVERAKPIPSSNSLLLCAKVDLLLFLLLKAAFIALCWWKLLFSGRRRHYHHRRLFRFLDFSQATLADQVDKQTEQSRSSSAPPHHRQQVNQFLLFASIVTSD